MTTILIVPQDTLISDLIGEFASTTGHDVVYPTHDETLLGRLRRSGASVALVDIEHSSDDEVAVVRQLRAAEVPVIVFSGRLAEGELQELAGSIATDVFALPAPARLLGKKIDAALARDEVRRIAVAPNATLEPSP